MRTSEETRRSAIAGSLEKLRERVLDLSRRNRLLNFGLELEGARSRGSMLRFVDVAPDEVMRELREEKIFRLQGIPAPRSGEEPGEVEPVYDLRMGGGGAAGQLWVAREAEDLSRVCRALEKMNRSSIDETGVGTLYLVFGFLEWGELGESRQVQHAPLLLAPVNLTRTGGTDYHLVSTGDEIEVNVTLRQMLRHNFAIELPEMGEPEGIGEWYAEVERVLSPGWRVRNQLVLANISFQKMRIWQDLDPAQWPEGGLAGGGLLDHPLVGDLLYGRETVAISSAEHHIDQLEKERGALPLISDADSSQHSALIDALSGENLVIEGPPGTGKSQTIANLIALAIGRGKTVLFVAEKSTALEVVRKRLEEAGLGDFCLCLGPSRGSGREATFLSKTKDVLDSLRRRIDLKGSFSPPTELKAKQVALAEYRQRLVDYLEVMARPFGGGQWKIHEIVGAREKAFVGTSFPVSLIDGMVMAEASKLGPGDVEALRYGASIFSESLGRAMADSRVKVLADHPWFGVERSDLDADGEAALLEALGRVAESTREIDQVLGLLRGASGFPAGGDRATVRQVRGLGAALPVIEPGLRGDWVELLADGAKRREAARGVELLREWRGLEERVAVSFGPGAGVRFGKDEVALLRSSCARIDQLGVGGMTLGEASGKAGWIDSLADYLVGSAKEIFGSIVRHFELEPVYEMELIRPLLEVIGFVGEISPDLLDLRQTVMEKSGLPAVIEQARQQAERLRQLKDSISERLDMELSPPPEVLARHMGVCANAGIARLASRDYRQARRDWRGMARERERPTPEQMVSDFRDLLRYNKALFEFTSNRQYRESIGPLFRDLETPFAGLLEVAKWFDRVKVAMGVTSEAAQRLTGALLRVPTVNLRSLTAGLGKPEVVAFRKFFAKFESYRAYLPPAAREGADGDLMAFAGRMKDYAASLQAVVGVLGGLGTASEVRLGSISAEIDRLEEMVALRERIGAHPELGELLGEGGNDPATDPSGISRVIEVLDGLEASALPEEVRRWLISSQIESRTEWLRGLIVRLGESEERLLCAEERVAQVAGLDAERWYRGGRSEVIAKIGARAERALGARDLLAGWVATRVARGDLDRRGLAGLADMVDDGRIDHREIGAAVLYILYNTLLQEARRLYPEMSRFRGESLDESRRRFAELDREVIRLNRELIASEADRREVPLGSQQGLLKSHADLGLIKYLMSLSRPQMKIRQLVSRAGGALVALKPCMMMSPLAVAQYLPPGSIRFDLVVMDEASQLRPEDALGAIARASQVVVVGDRMQLPPTSFFNTIGAIGEEAAADGSTEDDDLISNDLTSVLEIAGSRYPVRMLKWHYRSRHESLIDFSNRNFYDGRLIVFPSPAKSLRAEGLRFHHVADGVYEDNRNRREAERVVREAIAQLAGGDGRSLGIVSLNSRQQELIEDLLQKDLAANPLAERAYRQFRDRGEDVFVKNLESVQGDERDIIMISTTFGRRSDGRTDLRLFGAINNRNYGHRRLNVLITRARQRIDLYSSIAPGEVQPAANSSQGLTALLDYLAYAKSGSVPVRIGTGRLPDSDFEIAVAESLRQKGYVVEPQVGVAGYWIDLAVRHPQRRGEFLLAVECDGASYHSSRSARDRDRLRQSVLEGLGWKFHRIWSTDWFRNRDQEMRRLLRRIEDLEQADTAPLSRQTVTAPVIRQLETAPLRDLAGIELDPELEQELDRGRTGRIMLAGG